MVETRVIPDDRAAMCVKSECKREEEETGDGLAAEAARKKHSGPRKRRPKKKKAEEGEDKDGDGAVETPQATEEPPVPATASQPPLPEPMTLLRASAKPFAPTTSSPVLHINTQTPFQTMPAVVPYHVPYGYYHRLSPLLHGTHPELVDALPPLPGESETPHDRAYWTQYVIEAAEKERARRLQMLKQLQEEEEAEIRRRRSWAIRAIEQEQQAMMREMFLDNMKNTQWFQSTISRFAEDYEVVCPNSWFGCTFSCMLRDLEAHLERCVYRQVPDTLDHVVDESLAMDLESYDVVCPNAMLGCNVICSREDLAAHLAICPVNGMSREKEWQERQEWQQSVIQMTEEERARRMHEDEDGEQRFTFGHLQRLYEEQTAMMQVVLHDEITKFAEQCQQEAAHRDQWIKMAINQMTEEITTLWGSEALVKEYGSFATQLHSGYSDVDLVVFGVTKAWRNPKTTSDSTNEATGNEGIVIRTSQECVSELAAHLSSSSVSYPGSYSDISAITRASIPLVKVIVTVRRPSATGEQEDEVVQIPFDITFDDPQGACHNGIASATLIQELTKHFYGLKELTFVLKRFLAKRNLSDPYVGGLSSYGLKLMILFVLEEQGSLNEMVAEPIESQTDGVLSSVEFVDQGDGASSRYEAQRRKGTRVAKDILRHARVKVQRLKSIRTDEATATQVHHHPHRNRRNVAAAWEVLRSNSEGGSGEIIRTTERKPFLLGKLLMDVLQFYGNDFRPHVDQIAVLVPESTGVIASPSLAAIRTASPRAKSPPVIPISPAMTPHDAFMKIQDPLQHDNNVGKTCYRISQVLRDFSDFLSFLTALIVRGRVLSATSANIQTIMSSVPEEEHEDEYEAEEVKQNDTVPTRNKGILHSVFEMKSLARESRSSIDLSGAS